MRIIKGSKVEVLRKKEVPPGEWHCAKIISGNGHTYSVMYEEGSTSRHLWRECQGSPLGLALLLLETMEALGSYWDVMRSSEFTNPTFRVRQAWQDDEWVVIGKGSGSCEIVKSNKPSSLNCHQMTSEFPQLDTRRKIQAGNNCLAAQDNTCFQEAIEKEGERQRVISKSPSPLLEKVDAVAYPQANLEPIDCDSDASFVGSCSVVSNSPNSLSGHILSSPPQDADTLNSDADSFYDCGDEEGRCPLPLKDDVATSTHRLGLHTYRSTLEAIYASGPLSWEQEALLTNLRISLNISNDEHLMEIRNLKSAGNGLHLS
uniref:ENT domain-containing protein n=1 Tax=Fagus sylvatica TaxID=28930 RepID=A0A2N9HBE3_FAGSY